MIEIIVRDNSSEAFERAMKELKREIAKDDFLKDLKDRQYYTKPSDAKRKQERERKYNLKNNKEK